MNEIMPYVIGFVAAVIVVVIIRDSWRYRAIRSGTDKHPTPPDLISALLDSFLLQDQKEVVTFEVTAGLPLVQILRVAHRFILNVSTPDKRELDPALRECGIAIPDHWSLKHHSRKKRGAEIGIPISEAERVKEFVWDVLTRLYGMQEGSRLRGYME